jgi:hypothetical protein
MINGEHASFKCYEFNTKIMASRNRKENVQVEISSEEKARWVDHADNYSYYDGKTCNLVRRAVEEKIERDINGEPNSEAIRLLRQENQHLRYMIGQRTKAKNTLNDLRPHAAKEDLIRDIIECLLYEPIEYGFPEPDNPADNLTILRVRDFTSLLPDYSRKDIMKTLRFNQDIFEYLPPYDGWRLLDAFPKPICQ